MIPFSCSTQSSLLRCILYCRIFGRHFQAGFFIDTIDLQKNNFAALSVGDGRQFFKALAAKRPIPSLLPCEMNFLKVYKIHSDGLYRRQFDFIFDSSG
jgi:hypothetical protein